MSYFDDLPPGALAEADQAGAQVTDMVRLLVDAVTVIATMPKADAPKAIEQFLESITDIPPNLKSAVVFQLALKVARHS